jgi:hypothetical protein
VDPKINMTTPDYRNRIKELWPKLQANDLAAKQELAALMKERRETKLCDCGCGKFVLKSRVRVAKYKKCQKAGCFFSSLCYQIWRRSQFLGALFLLATCNSSLVPAAHASITASWKAAKGAVNYRLYEGSSTNNFTNVVSGITTTNTTLTNVPSGMPVYFAVTQVASNGLQSVLSAPVADGRWSVSSTNRTYIVTVIGTGGSLGTASQQYYPTNGKGFFRSVSTPTNVWCQFTTNLAPSHWVNWWNALTITVSPKAAATATAPPCVLSNSIVAIPTSTNWVMTSPKSKPVLQMVAMPSTSNAE